MSSKASAVAAYVSGLGQAYQAIATDRGLSRQFTQDLLDDLHSKAMEAINQIPDHMTKEETKQINHRLADQYSDEELVDRCEALLDKLCESRDAWQMCVPPQPDDSDVLLQELIKRFKEI